MAFFETGQFILPLMIEDDGIFQRDSWLGLLRFVIDDCRFELAGSFRFDLRFYSIAAAAMPSTRSLPAMPLCHCTLPRENLVLLMIALWRRWNIGLVGGIDAIV